MRRIGALLGVLAGLLGVAFLLAGPASAHASVVGSDPVDGSRLKTVPSVVTITFDEPVGIAGVGYLHVTDAHGASVDAGAAYHPNGDATKVSDKLKPGLPDGTYTESWRVISADSHPVAGTIRFVVGNGPLAGGIPSTSTNASNGATSATFDAARWVSYAGIALLGGAWIVLTVWPQGRDDRRAQRLIWTGWGAAFVGGAAELLLQGPFTAGTGPGQLVKWSLLDDTLHTEFGRLHCGRLWLLGLLAFVLVTALQPGARRRPYELTALPLGLAILWTFSAGGHPSTTNPTWLSIPLDMAHLAAMSTWLGGLVLLAVAVLPRRDASELRAVLPVFSTAAFASVVVLAVTGTWAAWWGIGSLGAIFTTTYGLLVVGKIALFVGLVALGNLSRTFVGRRAARGPVVAYAATDTLLASPPPVVDRRPFEDDPVTVERLRRSVGVEVVVGLIVLVLTAVLVAQPRGPEAVAAQERSPVTSSAPLGGGRSVEVTANPGTHGPVDLTVTLVGATASKVTATATQQQAEIGPLTVPLHGSGTTWSGTVSLPVSGSWQFALAVDKGVFDSTTTVVTLDLH